MFTELADHQFENARRRQREGHSVSARDQYLKACNSYRAAEYFAPVGTSRHADLGHASRSAFARAMDLVDHAFEPAHVDVDGVRLPGYWLAPPDTREPGPTLVATSGFDGTLEETYLQVGRAARERGWRVLLVAGHGQRDIVRDAADSHFVPDTERWVSPWMDLALARAEVDPRRTALLGVSFGGYFVLRAVVADDRARAVIANSPIVDLRSYLVSFVGLDPETDMGEADDFVADIDDVPVEEMPPHVKEMSRSLIRRSRQSAFRATFAYLQQFTTDPAAVRCPSLALVGDGEGPEPRAQFERFRAGAGGPVTGHVFTRREGADSHCQVGNPALSNAVVFDWLGAALA